MAQKHAFRFDSLSRPPCCLPAIFTSGSRNPWLAADQKNIHACTFRCGSRIKTDYDCNVCQVQCHLGIGRFAALILIAVSSLCLHSHSWDRERRSSSLPFGKCESSLLM